MKEDRIRIEYIKDENKELKDQEDILYSFANFYKQLFNLEDSGHNM